MQQAAVRFCWAHVQCVTMTESHADVLQVAVPVGYLQQQLQTLVDLNGPTASSNSLEGAVSTSEPSAQPQSRRIPRHSAGTTDSAEDGENERTRGMETREVRGWVRDRLLDYVEILSGLMRDKEPGLRVSQTLTREAPLTSCSRSQPCLPYFCTPNAHCTSTCWRCSRLRGELSGRDGTVSREDESGASYFSTRLRG